MKQRTHSLDLVKCLAAFLIVFIHSRSYTNGVHTFLMPLTRVAVPLFFMITGFYWNNGDRARGLRQLKKIASITLIGVVSYLAYELIVAAITGVRPSFADKLTSPRAYFDLLAFNLWMSDFSSHLWYLLALIYGIVIFLVLRSNERLVWCHRLIVPLFALACAISFTERMEWYRNWLFLALPCMLLGHYLGTRRPPAWKPATYWALILLFAALLPLESWFYRATGLETRSHDIYVMAIPLFTMIFMAAIAFPQCGRKTVAATIGRRYSKWIYIYHMMLIPPITSIVSHYPALEPWTPILVFTLATATVALVMGLARIAKPHHAR